jgi:hypothetical protein
MIVKHPNSKKKTRCPEWNLLEFYVFCIVGACVHTCVCCDCLRLPVCLSLFLRLLLLMYIPMSAASQRRQQILRICSARRTQPRQPASGRGPHQAACLPAPGLAPLAGEHV